MSLYRNNVASTVSGAPGTGTITLGSALIGAQSFSAAYGADATVDVFITDGTDWEVARDCAYTHSGTTLTRGTREDSSTGSVLDLTAGAVVRVALPAGQANDILALLRSKTLDTHTPMTSQPPATAFATLDTRNSIAVLDFDDAVVESITWVGIIPVGVDLSSGIEVRIFWMATTATSGNVRWRAEWERTGTDLDSDSFDTATEATSAANGTSGIESVASITCTAIDGLTPGDRYRLRISRVGNDATNDTMTGDAELVAVEIRQVA